MTVLKKFRDRATADEQAELAAKVGTTREYLFSHMGVHRDVQIEKAEAIEQATSEIATRNGGRTPVVRRHELCAICARCPFSPKG